MQPSDENKRETFAVSVKTPDSVALLLHQILEMRADLSALSIITTERLAQAVGADAQEIATRFELLRQEFLLRHTFELQDASSQSLDKQSPDAG